MKREVILFIDDILISINAIEDFSTKMSKEKLINNRLYQSAIVREIEIIGEAVKSIPTSFREKHPEIPWAKMAGMRDVIIHSYFSVDLGTVWKVIKDDLPILKKQILKIKKELEGKE